VAGDGSNLLASGWMALVSTAGAWASLASPRARLARHVEGYVWCAAGPECLCPLPKVCLRTGCGCAATPACTRGPCACARLHVCTSIGHGCRVPKAHPDAVTLVRMAFLFS
jgi:hypothetical protein